MSKHTVFRVKSKKGTNIIKLKCVGLVETDEKYADEPIICNDNLPTSPNNEDQYVHEISDTVHMRFYKCNIIDSFLMATKKLPVLYASILYQTHITAGLLFNIFVHFKIKTEIKNEQQLVNSPLEGLYDVSLKIDDETIHSDLKIDVYMGDKAMIEKLKEFVKTDEIKKRIIEVQEKRRLERIEKIGSYELDDDESFEPPTPKFIFKNLVEEYKKTGKIDLNRKNEPKKMGKINL